MHTRLLKNCVLVSLVAGLPAAAHAAHDDSERGWNVSIVGGYSGGLSGSLTPFENSVIDLSALDPSFSGAGGAAIDRLRYGDAFQPGAGGGIEAGYGLNDHVSLYTRLTVARFLGRGLELGVTRPDRIQASLTSTDSAFTAREVDFTDNRRVLAASIVGGADLSLAKTFGLRFSLGADYAGAPRGAQDPTLGTLGVNVDRDAGARVDYPLEIDAVFRLH